METRKLEVLLEAVRIGSFSKTAEKLGYSQSALVHMMNSLEQEIGVPLLSRSYSGVSFSAEGKQLEPLLRAMVNLETDLKNKVKELSSTKANRIRIVSVPSIATYWLPDAINHVRHKNPELEIEISVVGLDVCDVVERGDADIGFTAEGYVGNNEWLPLFDDEFYVAIPASWPYPPDTAIPLEELLSHTILIPGNNEKSGIALHLKKIAQKQINVQAHGGSILLTMVERGLGVAFLSRLYQTICPPTVRMLPIEPTFSRKLGIVAKSFKALTPAQAKFVSYFKDYHPTE